MSKFGVVIVVTALLASWSAFAQDSSQPATGPSTEKHKRARGDRADQRLKRLSKKLSLTDEQKEKARPILQDEEKQLTDLDADSALTPQQKHKKTREIRMASRSQLDGILTPEQKEKLPARRAGAGGRRHKGSTTAAPSTEQTPQ